MLVCHTGKWTTINVEPYTAFGIKHAHAQMASFHAHTYTNQLIYPNELKVKFRGKSQMYPLCDQREAVNYTTIYKHNNLQRVF